MNISPHWQLRTYMHEFRQGNNGEKGKFDARFPVLMTLFLHVNTRLRCWPSTDTLCKETGFESQAVVEARKWLIKRKALILVPYDKREGKERQLPKRQFVYQLTGVIETSDGLKPYLAMRDEIADQVKAEVAGLSDEVLQGTTLPDDEVLQNETLTGEGEVLQTEILVGKTKALTNIKVLTNKEADQESSNEDSLNPDTANAASGSDRKFGLEIGQQLWWVEENKKTYQTTIHEITITRFTKKLVVFKYEFDGQTFEKKRKANGLWKAKPKLERKTTPLQDAIGECVFSVPSDAPIGKEMSDTLNRYLRAILKTYPKITAEHFRAAYKWKGEFTPTEIPKVIKMLGDYRKHLAKTLPQNGNKPRQHFPLGQDSCPVCGGSGAYVNGDMKTIPCPQCLEAEQAQRAEAV